MNNVLNKFNLMGQTAVITGGAGFLGKSLIDALLQSNCNVVILDISSKNISQTKKIFSDEIRDNKVLLIKTDITKEIEVKKSLSMINKKFKAIPSILINNAAIDSKPKNMANNNLENFNSKQWEKELDVGLKGAFLCCKHFGKAMAKNRKGNIVNISSDLGLIAPNQAIYKSSMSKQSVKPITYSVVKHGLIGLTRYIATYWAKEGVRCNAFAPGGIYNNQSSKFVNELEKLIPLGRMADIDEYQATILYLCSDASSYMNGAILSVDGGRTAW